MARALEPLVDWRDGAQYRALLGIDRAGLAWEWLRRDPAYIACAAHYRPAAVDRDLIREDPAALPWGLHFLRGAGPFGIGGSIALAGRS
jgi:hypothetical protein